MNTLMLSSMDVVSNFLDILSFFTPLILLFGICIFPFTYKTFKSSAKIIALFMILALLTDIGSRVYSAMYNINLVFVNISSFIELCGLSFYLYSTNKMKDLKFAEYIYTALFILNFYEFISTDFSDESTYQCFSKPLHSLVLFIHFIISSLKNIENNIQNIDSTFINLLLLYLAINCIVNLPLNILVNYNDSIIFVVWIINCINVFFFYCSMVWYTWKSKNFSKTTYKETTMLDL